MAFLIKAQLPDLFSTSSYLSTTPRNPKETQGPNGGVPEAEVGVSVTVQGQTRLAHALGLELFDALQIGIRCGKTGHSTHHRSPYHESTCGKPQN